MTTEPFERARSAEAKHLRETAILDSAARLATERGVREVTLTDIAAGVGMHKSAMLRYFETREEIFLRLSAAGWTEWSAAMEEQLDRHRSGSPGRATVDRGAGAVARLLADTLVERPLFCDLLAHTPLNLERGVSFEAVKAFKLETVAAATAVAARLSTMLPITDSQALNVVATATAMAGALWQMAAPGTELRRFYETDPALAHTIVDVAPRLTDILSTLLHGYITQE